MIKMIDIKQFQPLKVEVKDYGWYFQVVYTCFNIKVGYFIEKDVWDKIPKFMATKTKKKLMWLLTKKFKEEDIFGVAGYNKTEGYK